MKTFDLPPRLRDFEAVTDRRAKASLSISEATIRHVARRFSGSESLATRCLKATCREFLARTRRRINFRHFENDAACRAYGAMPLEDFAEANAMQAWANWRTIPRNLNGKLVQRPVTAVDLCSGIGDSTAVLAYYCAPGSRILGLEYNPTFVDYAARRTYLNRHDRPADVRFRAQSVLDPFCEVDGTLIETADVDLINASGAVGCHFDRAAMSRLAQECARVLRPGGLALIDARRGLSDVGDVADVYRRNGFDVIGHARSCVFDRGRQLCLRKRG